MPEVLLDSDILSDHLRGYEPARQYLKRFEVGEMQGYLSIITVAELAAGQLRQAQEEEKILRLLALFTPLAPQFSRYVAVHRDPAILRPDKLALAVPYNELTPFLRVSSDIALVRQFVTRCQ